MEGANTVSVFCFPSPRSAAVLIVLAVKYSEGISSYFVREELIEKFRPGEISAAKLVSSSMPRHADARHRGGGDRGEAFSHFPSPKLEKLATRKARSRASRIFCGTLSGTRSSHGCIVSIKGKVMQILFILKGMSFYWLFCFSRCPWC